MVYPMDRPLPARGCSVIGLINIFEEATVCLTKDGETSGNRPPLRSTYQHQLFDSLCFSLPNVRFVLLKLVITAFHLT